MRTDVTFLSNPESLQLYFGSTLLRGCQLSKLLASRLSDRYCITFATDCKQTDGIVILTKGFLATSSLRSLADLRASRNLLLADPVDLEMSAADLTALASRIDGFVASSKQQMITLKSRFPDKPVHLVTHAVDQRLPVFVPPGDKFRLAYVGLRTNCRHADELEHFWDIVETPTDASTDRWITRLDQFNCHYALRRAQESVRLGSFIKELFKRPPEPIVSKPFIGAAFGRPQALIGFKPFTKGFTAAHCACPILTERRESDAQFYLPDDYPFFLTGGNWSEVSEVIMRVRQEFGSTSWRYAADVMRDVRDKSSPDHIANEFATMLCHYL
jgi:hypothetical protein